MIECPTGCYVVFKYEEDTYDILCVFLNEDKALEYISKRIEHDPVKKPPFIYGITPTKLINGDNND